MGSDNGSRRGRANPAGSLGTLSGVFTPSILTILGIVLFLRLGFVVGSGGLVRTLRVMALASSLALVTSISLSATATNLRVRGGGVYYLISRSLGSEFGGALGILLFVAQSVSIAFYCIGFGETLGAVLGPGDWTVLGAGGHGYFTMPRLLGALAVLMLFGLAWLGVDWATRMQFGIMAVLAAALVSFLAGGVSRWDTTLFVANCPAREGADGFWMLFALFFPAVTGFTQGANMSGDLKKPERSLPLGVLSAVAVSILVYFGSAILLAGALPRTTLVGTYGSLKQVARFGWMVDAGVVAAALSSALASFLGAPRILQSLARDRVFPFLLPFARCDGSTANPRRGTMLSAVIACATIGLGNLNAIARVVSMSFLIAYGLLNYATYIEAHGASPSFRPRFRWFHARLSLLGALACLLAIVAIDAMAGAVSLAVLFAIYQYLQRTAGPSRWADGRRSYHFQRAREALLAMGTEPEHSRDWRPRLLTFSDDPCRREQLLHFASWIEAGSGMNTMVRILEGHPEELLEERSRAEADLRAHIEEHGHDAFALALVAPDVRSGSQALLQCFGVGPLRANTVLLNWIEMDPGGGTPASERRYGDHLRMANRLGCNVVVFRAQEVDWRALDFVAANERRIDVWWWDDACSRLMLMLAYLMTRSEAWSDARIRVLAPRSRKGTEKTRESLQTMLRDARIVADAEVVVEPSADAIVERSENASLVLLPLRMRGKQPLDPFGDRLEPLLDRLPLVALVRAAEDIDLDADPEVGKAYQITAALDAALDAVNRARKAEKQAERALAAAEKKRRTAEEGIDPDDPVGQELLERAALLATESANRLERQARKARAAAENAACAAQSLCADSPRLLRARADALAARACMSERDGSSDG
ncbi:MAG: amino acid permease [Candidatus Krumholzibacteriia bacterium]